MHKLILINLSFLLSINSFAIFENIEIDGHIFGSLNTTKSYDLEGTFLDITGTYSATADLGGPSFGLGGEVTVDDQDGLVQKALKLKRFRFGLGVLFDFPREFDTITESFTGAGSGKGPAAGEEVKMTSFFLNSYFGVTKDVDLILGLNLALPGIDNDTDYDWDIDPSLNIQFGAGHSWKQLRVQGLYRFIKGDLQARGKPGFSNLNLDGEYDASNFILTVGYIF